MALYSVSLRPLYYGQGLLPKTCFAETVADTGGHRLPKCSTGSASWHHRVFETVADLDWGAKFFDT